MDRMDKDNLLSIILKHNNLSSIFINTIGYERECDLMNLVDDFKNTENQLNQNKYGLGQEKDESLKQQQNIQKISLNQATKDRISYQKY